jgi:hypothetical protein
MTSSGTVLPAPTRTARPPAELRSRALRFDGDALSRLVLLDLVTGELEDRRPAPEVAASLAMFTATR